MENKVIRAEENLTAQQSSAAMQISFGHKAPGASNSVLGACTPTTGADELKAARQDYWASYAPLPGEVGEAMVLRFLMQNMREFKLYLQNHPNNLRIAAQRWIQQSVSSCDKSRIHAETAQMLGFFSDPELLEEWETWKTELAAEKDAANNRMLAARKKAISNN